MALGALEGQEQRQALWHRESSPDRLAVRTVALAFSLLSRVALYAGLHSQVPEYEFRSKTIEKKENLWKKQENH